MAPLSKLKWEDPPTRADNRKIGVWEAVLQQLKRKPERWARIRTFEGEAAAGRASSTCSNLRTKRLLMPPGEYEFSWGLVPGSTTEYGVWGRFMHEEAGDE